MGQIKITDDMHTAQYVLWNLVDNILKLLSLFDNLIFFKITSVERLLKNVFQHDWIP